MQVFLRKYGTSGTIDFDLYSTDGSTILTSAAFASGCCVVSLDSGTSALSINLPSITQNGFFVNFSSFEMTSKRLHIKFVDTNPTKSWLDTSFVVETYGTSSAQHADIASGLLSSVVDTIPLQQLFTELLASISGYITKSGDQYSYLLRDNSTVAYTLSAGANNRIRV